MSFHALYVCRLANELNQLLQGATLYDLYSTEKNHLFIRFNRPEKGPLTLSFRVEGGKLFLYFPEAEALRPKHALDQFKAAWNRPVRSVSAHPGERSFHVYFGGASLLFLCYGRQAEVLWLGQHDGQVFRNKTTTKYQFSNEQLKELADGHWPANRNEFLNSSFITPVLKENFLLADDGPTFENLLQAYLEGPVFLNKGTDHYYLDALRNDHTVSEFTSLSEALTPYTELQLSFHFYTTTKEGLLLQLGKEISNLEKRLRALEKQLVQLHSERNYRHLGDLILSNLPQIREGMEYVDLIDYLDGKEIRIPLKEKLSPQDNAQRFYRKAKNQHLQEARLTEEIAGLESRYFLLSEKRQAVDAAQTMQELRVHVKEKKKQTEQVVRLPYHRFAFQDYEILVGKQAKDNDELTLKIAKKDDLWLHARDVGGSHVVIRKKGQFPIPESVLMAAAGLALWFSKRRTEALAPVIYTEKKFIRKRKGDQAGAVVVDKEKVIMAEPVAPDQF